MKIFYEPRCVQARYEFETTRKPGWIAASLAAEPIAGVQLVGAPLVREEELCAIHDPGYVAAVRTGEPYDLACSQGFVWEPLLYDAARAAVGCLLASARAAREDGVAGSLGTGFHHAKRGRGQGCCTFNGLAVAVLDALARGAGRVLVVDVDAHCGGGTYSLLADTPGVVLIDISTSPVDGYRAKAPHCLDLVRDAGRYLETLRARLREQEGGGFGLCILNAGMDAFEGCDTGGLAGVGEALLAAREEMVFSWCASQGVPITFALAGGYLGPRFSRAALVGLHRMTIETGARYSRRLRPN